MEVVVDSFKCLSFKGTEAAGCMNVFPSPSPYFPCHTFSLYSQFSLPHSPLSFPLSSLLFISSLNFFLSFSFFPSPYSPFSFLVVATILTQSPNWVALRPKPRCPWISLSFTLTRTHAHTREHIHVHTHTHTLSHTHFQTAI